MIAARSRRERRDRDSGLLFSWRLPVGNGVTICMAAVVVALLALGLSSLVRVKVSETLRRPERRGSLLVPVPGSADARAMELIALEAGPFPAQSHPGRDPAVTGLLSQAINAGMPAGTAYQPAWQEVQLPVAAGTGRVTPAVVLPPLPSLALVVQREVPKAREPRVVALSGSGGIRLSGPVPAGIPEGARFLVSYGEAGIVTEAMLLEPTAQSEGDSDAAWLLGASVSSVAKGPGWLAVEVLP